MGKYLKAYGGGIVAGLTYLQAASDGGITWSEGIGAAIATLLGLGVVYVVPNKPTVSTATIQKPGEPTTTVRTETE